MIDDLHPPSRLLSTSADSFPLHQRQAQAPFDPKAKPSFVSPLRGVREDGPFLFFPFGHGGDGFLFSCGK